MRDISFKNEIEDFVINCPIPLQDKIVLISTVELANDEKEIFWNTLLLPYKQLEKENIQIECLRCVHIFFTPDGNLEIINRSKAYWGVTFSLIIYSIDKFRQKGNPIYYCTIFLEELCHHFWNIEDEKLVKHKVLEIMQNLKTDFVLSDIYPDGAYYE